MQTAALIVVALAFFVSLLIFAPSNDYLIDIEPIVFSPRLFESFDGPLKHNTILSNADHLFVDKIHGPESLAYWEGQLYTGTFGGLIVRIDGTKLVPIAKIGNGKCFVQWEVEKCGRPLGLRFNSKGILYVVDAYFGLYKIQFVTSPKPKVTQLLALSATKNIKGGESVFFDDITIEEGAGENGGDVIYISDVSTKWDLSKFLYTLLEHDTSGRLLRFDTDTRDLTKVGKNFVFPNGVQITDDKQSILVCELGRQRLIRTFINGPKAGANELFTLFPGECDNIRRSADTENETYWVALPSVRNTSTSSLLDRLSGSPLIRKCLGRFSYLTGVAIEMIGNMGNWESLNRIGYSLKSGLLFYYFSHSNYGMIVEVDINGNIITAYSSPNGETVHLSEVCEVKGKDDERILYLGSYSNSYLGKLVVRK